jgi:hypothetical protein
MQEYQWRRVLSRDALTLLLGVIVIEFIITGDKLPPRFAPCPELDWHFGALSLSVLSLSIMLLEGLTWVGWFITRAQAIPPKLERTGGLLLNSGGWTGLGLAFGLVAVAYVLRRPNLCEPLRLATMSLRDLLAIFSLAYGLLILAQSYFGLSLGGSSTKPSEDEHDHLG